MKLRPAPLVASVALALASCGQEQQVADSDVTQVDTSEDALAVDPSVVPPQDTSGQAPAEVATPTPEPTVTTPVEPVELPSPDPAKRT
jgi:hypothetical protein